MKYSSITKEKPVQTPRPWHTLRLTVCNICLVSALFVLAACKSKPPAVSDDAPEKPPLVETVLVPAGTFQMGSAKGTGNNNEYPAHTVTLNAFYLGKYEITQGQYLEVTGERPSNFKTNSDTPNNQDGWVNLPVEMISWYDALVFCNKLSLLEGYDPVYRVNGSTNPADWGVVPTRASSAWNSAEIVSGANGWRLPTEAEWEYAAKGGDGSPGGFTYAGSSKADDVSWYYDNSNFRIHGIGTKKPNALELYDMSGNVMEWCWDWFGDYKNASQQNPAGPASGLDRAIRGGAWSVSVQMSRCAYRQHNLPAYRGVNLGMRIARAE